jgi:uncharacterized protein YajQ (UPF0234 family)
MERLVVTSEAREVFQKINSEPLLNKNQKRSLTSIIQNEDVEITAEDIDEWGADIEMLRKEDLTSKQLTLLEKNINLVLDFLESCIVEDDLPF